MSLLFQLGNDSLRNVLSWLDFGSICYLDIAVGNFDERMLWLRSLQTIDNKAVDRYKHCHSSIRWLIIRGARTTQILARFSYGGINGTTFRGIGTLPILDMSMSYSERLASVLPNVLRRAFGLILRNRNITNGADTDVSVKMHGCPHLKRIDIECYDKMRNVGLRAIAQGCRNLTSINLSGCHYITDRGISAIAKGCPYLTTINLLACRGLTDVGILAIAKNCRHLKSIDISHIENLTIVGIEALIQRNLESMKMNGCLVPPSPPYVDYTRPCRS